MIRRRRPYLAMQCEYVFLPDRDAVEMYGMHFECVSFFNLISETEQMFSRSFASIYLSHLACGAD